MTAQSESDPNSVVIASYAADLSMLDLDNENWNCCRPIQITHYWSGDPAPATRHAEARVSWSGEGLTVRFDCAQQEPLIIADNPVITKKTIGLWDRDVCEIFLAPDVADANRYFEFEAAPSGEWIDLGIQITSSGRETDWDYESGMQTTAKIEADRILVALTIPWSSTIPKPELGDEWRVNLFRCVGPDEATRYLAWRPTRTPEPNFHKPSAFGHLRFV
jgi:hypothetical protein